MRRSKLKLAAVSFFAFSTVVFADTGGLTEATQAISTVQTWLYTLLGGGVGCYVLYHVIMAKLGKMSWGDVITAVIHCALAGGAVLAAQWAWSIFSH